MCCVGGSALFPTRLAESERLAAGVSVEVRDDFGSFDARGRYLAASPGALELVLQQRLATALRVTDWLQVGFTLPFVETIRRAGLTESGGGLGDAQFAARSEALSLDNALGLPGIALLGSLSLPTGTPVEHTRTPLSTGATGFGAWQGSLGVAFEYLVADALLLELTGAVTFRATRTVGGIEEALSPQLSAGFAAGWTFSNRISLSGVASFSREGDAAIQGVAVPNSGRGVTSMGVTAATPLPLDFRLRVSVQGELPIDGTGQGQSVGAVVSTVLLRAI